MASVRNSKLAWKCLLNASKKQQQQQWGGLRVELRSKRKKRQSSARDVEMKWAESVMEQQQRRRLTEAAIRSENVEEKSGTKCLSQVKVWSGVIIQQKSCCLSFHIIVSSAPCHTFCRIEMNVQKSGLTSCRRFYCGWIHFFANFFLCCCFFFLHIFYCFFLVGAHTPQRKRKKKEFRDVRRCSTPESRLLRTKSLRFDAFFFFFFFSRQTKQLLPRIKIYIALNFSSN